MRKKLKNSSLTKKTKKEKVEKVTKKLIIEEKKSELSIEIEKIINNSGNKINTLFGEINDVVCKEIVMQFVKIIDREKKSSYKKGYEAGLIQTK